MIPKFCFGFFAGLLLVASAVPAATVHVTGTSSTTEVGSVFNKKTLFLNLREAAEKLGITVRQDTATGVRVLCTPQDCVPVFEQDEAEVQRKDTTLFVRVDEIANALGCHFQVKKKRDVVLSCPSPLPQSNVGTQTGELAPGFRLKMDTTTTLALTDLLKQKPLMLVFFRNGDWDPFSKLLLKMVQANLDSIHALGYDIVGIHGYEPRAAMKWKKDLGLSFPLLSDEYSAVIRGYGVFDQGHFPLPSVFVVDRSGVIRLRHVFDLSGPPDLAPILKELRH